MSRFDDLGSSQAYRENVEQEFFRREVTYGEPETVFIGYREHFPNPNIGDEIAVSVAAPGIGKVTYVVTVIDKGKLYGYVKSSSVRELRASEVE